MKKYILLLTFFMAGIFFFSPVFADEVSPDIEIKQIYPEHLEVNPGQAVTVSFLVINHSSAETEFKENLTLPPDWQLVIPPSWFKLNANDQQVRLVSFFIPYTCKVGSYPISYSLGTQNSSGKTFSVKVNLTVLPLSTLKSMIEEKPLVVIAGEKYTVKMRYMNTGNCNVLLALSVKESPVYPMEVSPAQMDLQPGDSEVLTITVQTDEKLTSGISHLLDIKAKDKNSTLIYAEDNILMDILPKTSGTYNLYHRIPSQVKIIAGLETQPSPLQPNPILQLEFSGSGSIDDAGKNNINWLCITPNPFCQTSDQQMGSFQFNYATDFLNLNLGDKSAFLSPLTGRWDNLNNINLSFFPGRSHAKSSDFGVIYSGATELGAYYSYHFNQSTSLKFNFLNSNNNKDSKIVSLESQLEPFKDTALNLECAIDSHEDHKGESFAYHFDFHRLSSGIFNYSLEKIYAAPDYFANYNDCDSTNGTISYVYKEKWPVSISFYSYRNNLDNIVDDTKGSAHNDLTFNGNVSYILSPETTFLLTLDNSRKKDLLSSPSYDTEVNSVKLGLQHMFPSWRLAAFVEGGAVDDKTSQQEDGFYKSLNFNCNYTPNQSQTYSLYANIADRHFTVLPEIPDTKNAVGASINLKFRDSFAVNLDYQKSNFYTGNSGSDSLSFNFSYALGQLSLALQGSLTSDPSPDNFTASCLATYSLPWNMPISRRTDLGILKGKIYDAEKPENPPMANVILRANGITAVTNERGEFVFSALPPGDYSILIDKSLIGLNMVPLDKLPLTAEVKKGEVTDLQFGMVSAGKISGKAVLLTADQAKKPDNLFGSDNNLYTINEANSLKPDELKETGVLADIIIELTDGKETFRQVTDETGAFTFAGMRPGKWLLKVNADNLPPHYYFEMEESEVDLKPGEEKDVVIKALPQVRPVQIIEEGKIGTVNSASEK